MNTIRDLSFKLCKNYIEDTIPPVDKGSDDFYVKTFKDEEERVKLTVTNGEETFLFSLKKDGDKTSDEESFRIEGDDVTIRIEDVNMEDFHSAKFMDVDLGQLMAILKRLAHDHSKSIISERNLTENVKYPTYTLNTIENKHTLDILFHLSQEIADDDLDPNAFKDGIEKLLVNTEKVFAPSERNVCVKGNIFQKKLFFKKSDNQPGDCRLLYILKNNQPTPLIYDMLLTIFCLTDQNKRQHHFHELLDYYYHFMKQNLTELYTILCTTKYENQVKLFIPFVKLDLTLRYVRHVLSQQPGTYSKEKLLELLNSNKKYKEKVRSLILDLYEWVLYPRLNKEDCFKIVRNIIGSSDYKDLKYQVIPLGQLGGFLGEYYRVKIDIKGNSFNLFAKFVQSQFSEMDNELSTTIFEKEHFVYNIFVPELKNIGLGDIVDFLPTCYFSRITDVLVCEDMTELGYTRIGYRQPFTYEMLRIVVKQLAKFHACSWLYEEKVTKHTGEKTRIGDKFAHYVQEIFFRQDPGINKQLTDCNIRGIVNYVLDYFPDVPKKLTMEEFRQKSKHLFEVMFKKIERSDKYRNVLCHGDFWSGNIMMKLANGTPTNCTIIDFQLSRYCPPAQDLLVLFYINSDKETRRKYMSKLIDEYYAELSTILSRYGCDINDIMSYDSFMECCEYMKSQSVCQASIYYQTTLSRDILFDLEENQEKMIHFMMVDKKEGIDEIMENEEIKGRFREIVEELYDICISGQY